MLENQEKIIKLLKDVVNLVKVKNKVHQKTEVFNSKDIMKAYEEDVNSPTKKALYNYFENLSYEDIQLIQAIMNIGSNGKDHYCDGSKTVTPSQLLKVAIDSHKYLHGDKDRAISYILEKVPLDKYLALGAEVLNISLD